MTDRDLKRVFEELGFDPTNLKVELEALLEKLGKAVDPAQAACATGRHRLEQSVRERPLAALALAAVAGFLLSALMRR